MKSKGFTGVLLVLLVWAFHLGATRNARNDARAECFQVLGEALKAVAP